MLEVHAPHAREESWRDTDHRDDGEYPENIVLIDVGQTYGGIKQQLVFVGQMRLVIIERFNVALQAFEVRMPLSR